MTTPETVTTFTPTLTPRETEVATALANGQTVREVAAALGISPKTVDVHKTNLMKKLDIHNRATLTLWAVRVGLVRADEPIPFGAVAAVKAGRGRKKRAG